MNALIIDQFSKLVKQIQAELLNAQVENEINEVQLHKYRLAAVRKVLSIIRNLDFEIVNPADLDGIPGIGKRTISRVKEILDTGTLAELKNKYNKKKQAKIDSIQELEQVIGIGTAAAKRLVTEYNIKSIAELRKAISRNKVKVNRNILLGLKYYGIVQGNIPRREIDVIQNFLIKELHKISPDLDLVICGSYRRGKKASGDIDVLIYNPKAKTMKQVFQPKKFGLQPYLEIFVNELTKKGFLLDSMTDKNYNINYMGFCKYKKYPVRRIDIKYVPYNSLPSAMLHYTGPFELNTIMRREAKKRGMKLNEYGLFMIDRETGIQTPLKIHSEADIFEILGMDYLTPEERENFSAGKTKHL